ncbi:Alpha/Beta hydrolase protein [Pelagophyceae sp. CCMP2097]|nr:Alpha/Beta hydrolase protein [Pelagophyceae sp. CCMP2097]
MRSLFWLLALRARACRPATARDERHGVARRTVAHKLALSSLGSGLPAAALADARIGARTAQTDLVVVRDPETYSALAYKPKGAAGKLPCLIVLHGAGKNEDGIWGLCDPRGEHAGLPPSLIAQGKAPKQLTDNFAVVAPYSQGKRSFYEEPRAKLLRFVDFLISDAGRAAGMPDVDPLRLSLFGFSDGATVAVELLTTRRFSHGVVCAYGFTGVLPARAIQSLRGLPLWVFHSADDVIFPVKCADDLVGALRAVDAAVVRYDRFDQDQEGFTGSVRGHSTGITAAKRPDVYEWLLLT